MLPSLTGPWPWSAPCLEGKTLLSSREASMKSCTATAGFLASSGAEEMLVHLDRATSSMADACFAPSPDPLPIARAVTAASSVNLCLSWWTPDHCVLCYSCLHHWVTNFTRQESPACFLILWLVLLHCGGISSRGLMVALHIEKGLTAPQWLALSAWLTAPMGISVPSYISTAPSSSSRSGSAPLPDACCPGWHLCCSMSPLMHVPLGMLAAMPFPSERWQVVGLGHMVHLWCLPAELPLQRTWS